MLQSQVNYWNLQETKRHNKVMEELEGRKTDYQGLTANASVMQAETGRMLVPIEAEKARASTTQAEAAKENVAVNWLNANTNARNASTNERNADINAYNAETNRINANTAIFNADTTRMMTESNISLNESQEKVNSSVTKLNLTERDLTRTKNNIAEVDLAKGQIGLQYENANNILNLVGSGAEAFKDITSGTGSLINGVGNLFKKGSSSGDKSPFNVKNLINGVETIISVGKFIAP